MESNLMFKSSLIIYRFVLIISIPLFFIAEFMVGMAGHNIDPNNTNYILYVFAIITSLLLIIYKRPALKITLKNSIRISLIILVLISIICEIYGLFEFSRESYFGLGETVFVFLFSLFTAVSITLFYGLLRDRI